MISTLNCPSEPEGCSNGYYEQIGDLPGWSSVDGMGGGEVVSSCDECAAKCSSTSNCKSYECSHSALKCSLNSAADPSQYFDTGYGDYDFCTKETISMDVTDDIDVVSELVFEIQNMSIYIEKSDDDTSQSEATSLVPHILLLLFQSTMNLFIIVGAVVIICLVCIVCVCCRRKHSPLTISNALVAMIAIGDYSDGIKISAVDKDEKGIFNNLEVDKDIKTIQDLSKFMGWTFTSKGGKVHWTAKEITSFCEMEIGEMLFTANNKLKYDGLIVCVSCHGVKDNIVTSDIETIEKTAIHRMLSLKYPEIREIPRIFIFDCCNGSDRRHTSIAMNMEQPKLIEMTSIRKATELEDVQSRHQRAWTTNSKNPDYNLVVVHAANEGFVAKMSSDVGSYAVYALSKVIRTNVGRIPAKGLAELLEEVQNALHDQGKQQTMNVFNNHTRTLVFEKNQKL